MFNKIVNHFIDFFYYGNLPPRLPLMIFASLHISHIESKLTYQVNILKVKVCDSKDQPLKIVQRSSCSLGPFFSEQTSCHAMSDTQADSQAHTWQELRLPPSANIVNNHLSVIRESQVGKRSSNLRKDLWWVQLQLTSDYNLIELLSEKIQTSCY